MKSFFERVIIALILVNSGILIVDSFSIENQLLITVISWTEIISYIIFSIEYIIRFFSYIKKNKNIKYLFNFYMIIDLLSILPFYLSIDIDLIILRILRICKILKIGKYSKSIKILKIVIRNTKNELLSCFSIIVIIIFISSTFMYYIEGDVQPNAFPNIISTFWWAIATLTTVGYGDVYPITAAGKILTSIITLLSIGIVALPTGIISSGFINYFKGDENK